MLKAGMIIGNRYEILNKIGSGGMSTVYKGKDQKLNRNVAIKVLKSEYREDKNFIRKFREEAQAAAGLAHPNIVNVYDVGEEDGIYYIVMELVEGITLKNYIERKGKLTIKEATSIAIQVSMGLEVAHNNDIVHRDIKPQNIMISKDGKVKVTDFGIAKAASSDTISSNAMGSVHYTSPEQARGGYSDAKSDIYSLGIVMYEMVTGRVPFDGETTVAVAVKHLQEEMISPKVYCPELPVSLEQIILKCTEKIANRRYANMAELIADLKQSLITPEEDFVKKIDVDTTAKTVVITKGDLYQTKKETGRVPVSEDEEPRKPEKKSKFIPVPEDDDYDTDEDDEDEDYEEYDGDEDDDDEDDMDPRLEKLMTVGGIIAAIIIVIIILMLAGKILGFGKSASKDSTDKTEQTSGTIEVPSVLGETYDDAKKTLNDMGLGIASGGTASSTEYEEGQIISQDVKKGSMVEENTTITVVVCDNSSEKVKVPDVVGKSKSDAAAAMKAEGFAVDYSEVYDDDVAEGYVIKSSPVAGTETSKGSTIILSVSRGKDESQMTEVPNLQGKTQESANSALSDADLEVGTVTEEYSDSYDAGTVISQGTTKGTKVDKGTKISYVLSKGPEGVQVPILIGATQAKAEERLGRVGLKVSVEQVNSDSYAAGIVTDCDPGEESSVKAGSTVKIYVSKGAATYKYSGNVSAPSEAAQGTEFTVSLKDANGSTISSGSGTVGSAVSVSGSGMSTSSGTVEITYTKATQADDGSTVTEQKSSSSSVNFTKE